MITSSADDGLRPSRAETRLGGSRTEKQEDDGDYHLVVEGPSGDTMIVEVPPTKPFIGTSPWLDNIRAARAQIDSKLLAHLSARDFVPLDGVLVPRGTVSVEPESFHIAVESVLTRPEGQEGQTPAFQTLVNPTPVRITGVGFFDAVHGQTGVAQLNGLELNPMLKIKWIVQ